MVNASAKPGILTKSNDDEDGEEEEYDDDVEIEDNEFTINDD
jgi:hypothetical protein